MESTEFHFHYHEEECVYILSGNAMALIGDQEFDVREGDFIGYRAAGKAHKIINTGNDILKCIVVGQRLDHDVADYPQKNKRIFRQKGLKWNLVDIDKIVEPNVGKK